MNKLLSPREERNMVSYGQVNGVNPNKKDLPEIPVKKNKTYGK